MNDRHANTFVPVKRMHSYDRGLKSVSFVPKKNIFSVS